MRNTSKSRKNIAKESNLGSCDSERPRSENTGAYTTGLLERLGNRLAFIDARLAENTWLAGDKFTAADIMTVFTFTTMRVFYSLDLTGYPGILAYLGRVAQREGYKKARAKADQELEMMIEGKPP
ncbi:glutathione S-transferase [Mycena rosella]|uniref:Glutathione S-transferase n=1 Tax=Mycena rosella TaxID=1033263 RepID=A0AAD7DPK2_MYCRO|nr:glutathione S-transferase [Mycena rosella]